MTELLSSGASGSLICHPKNHPRRRRTGTSRPRIKPLNRLPAVVGPGVGGAAQTQRCPLSLGGRTLPAAGIRNQGAQRATGRRVMTQATNPRPPNAQRRGAARTTARPLSSIELTPADSREGPQAQPRQHQRSLLQHPTPSGGAGNAQAQSSTATLAQDPDPHAACQLGEALGPTPLPDPHAPASNAQQGHIPHGPHARGGPACTWH